jgi:predicted metalloendopeptidase
VALVGGRAGLGEALGELYVARYFKPESKAAMDKLVENLRAALRQNIAGIDWMGEATKAQAYASWRRSARRSAIRRSGWTIPACRWCRATCWRT